MNTKISFLIAAQTALNQIANGTVLGCHLKVTQWYLIYTCIILDSDKDTAYKVTIDVGNSHVLYTSEDQQIGSFSHIMFGPFGHGGFGGSGFWHDR
jgi:hypothetical protein